MNKVTTVALAGLVAVAATASASVSRRAGFGDANAYIADVQDSFSLPGVVASNKDATYFEFGPSTAPSVTSPSANVLPSASPWGGVHAQVGPGVLGVWVNRSQNSDIKDLINGIPGTPATLGNISLATLNTELGGTAASVSAANLNGAYAAGGRVDLFYAFGLSDNMDLGVQLSRANRNYKTETGSAGNSYDANALGLGVGVEIKEVAIFKLLEVGLDFDMDGNQVVFKGASDDKLTTSANFTSLRVGGDVAGDDGAFGRLEVGFGIGSASQKNEVTTATPGTGDKEFKNNNLRYNLGYAIGKSGDKGMGLVGLMLTGNSGASETDANNSKVSKSNLALQLTSAGEAKVKEWLTARAGIAANLFQTSSTDTAGTPSNTVVSTSNNSVATLSTGLSVNLGSLTIDGSLNQDVLYTGGYLLSGVPEALFSQVSATWGW